MRPSLLLALCAPLALVPLALATQGDEEEQPRAPFTRYREGEVARFEEALPGVWLLVEYAVPGEVFERGSYRGYASFQDGFFTLVMHLTVVEGGFLGPRPQTYVQAGVHRYRVSREARLQTATALGFDNVNEDAELAAEPSAYPREYDVELAGEDLELRRADGVRFAFRRVRGGAFPEHAAEALERYRGREFVPPEDWGRRRR